MQYQSTHEADAIVESKCVRQRAKHDQHCRMTTRWLHPFLGMAGRHANNQLRGLDRRLADAPMPCAYALNNHKSGSHTKSLESSLSLVTWHLAACHVSRGRSRDDVFSIQHSGNEAPYLHSKTGKHCKHRLTAPALAVARSATR